MDWILVKNRKRTTGLLSSRSHFPLLLSSSYQSVSRLVPFQSRTGVLLAVGHYLGQSTLATPVKRRLNFDGPNMGSRDEVVEIDSLERALLAESRGGAGGGDAGAGDAREEQEVREETVLYTASFQEMEENFVKYQTALWILYSLLLMLAWGIGLFMLLYLPVRRYILRRDIGSRKLYLTPNAIVYKVTRPVPFPCFGVLKKEKYVLLPSVADVVIEQGYLQSYFGVYSLRIENAGVRRPPSDDVRIQGIANPSAFRKAVLTRLSYMRSEAVSQQASAVEDVPNLRLGHSPSAWQPSPSKSIRHDLVNPGELMLLQKLEEVGSSVKRVQSLIEEQRSQTTESIG